VVISGFSARFPPVRAVDVFGVGVPLDTISQGGSGGAGCRSFAAQPAASSVRVASAAVTFRVDAVFRTSRR
jgi:hypothetical protein